MNIKMFKNQPKNTYSFQISTGKKILLSGKDFTSKERCLANIKRTLHLLRTNDMINVRSNDKKGYLFSIGNSESRLFSNLEEASDALAYLKEEANTNKTVVVELEGKITKEISKKVVGQTEEGYDYKQISKTNKPGFELLDKEKERLYFFHFNTANGKPMIFSRAYDGKRRRTKAAHTLIAAVKEKQLNLEEVNIKGKFIFVLKDAQNLEIARSKTYRNKSELQADLKYFKTKAADKAKILKLSKKKKKATKLPKERFLLKQNAPLGIIGFESFRSPDNKCHYFHYHDKAKTPLIYSTAFSSRKKRDACINEIIALSQTKERYVMREKKGKHYFVIENDKGKTLVKSRYFKTKNEMILGMRHLLGNAIKYKDPSNSISLPNIEKIPIALANIKLDKESALRTPKKIEPKTRPNTSKPPQNPRPAKTPSASPAQSNTNPDKNPNSNRKEQNQKPPVVPSNQKGSSKQPNNRPSNNKPNPNTKKPANNANPNQRNKRPAKSNQNSNNNNKRTERTPRRKNNLPPLKEAESTRRSTTSAEQADRAYNQSYKSKAEKAPPRIQPSTVTNDPSAFNWRLLLIPLLLLFLFGILFKFCFSAGFGDKVVPPVKTEKPAPTKNVKPVKEVKPVEKIPTFLGPTGATLGFTKGSLAARLADFLSLPASVLPETFLLDKVHFSTNQKGFHQDAYEQLDRVAQTLKAYPNAIVSINGHTDNVGAPENNIQLSQNRAMMVKNYLVQKGVAINRLSTNGFGETRPIQTNETEEGRQANRRTEIELLRR